MDIPPQVSALLDNLDTLLDDKIISPFTYEFIKYICKFENHFRNTTDEKLIQSYISRMDVIRIDIYDLYNKTDIKNLLSRINDYSNQIKYIGGLKMSFQKFTEITEEYENICKIYYKIIDEIEKQLTLNITDKKNRIITDSDILYFNSFLYNKIS